MQNGNPWLDATALASLVSVALSIVKPLIEQVPGLGPNDKAHDAVIRLLNLALNLGGVVLLAAQAGQLSAAGIPGYVVLAGLQAGGSHMIYQIGSGSQPAPAVAPVVPVLPALDPATDPAMDPAVSAAPSA